MVRKRYEKGTSRLLWIGTKPVRNWYEIQVRHIGVRDCTKNILIWIWYEFGSVLVRYWFGIGVSLCAKLPEDNWYENGTKIYIQYMVNKEGSKKVRHVFRKVHFGTKKVRNPRKRVRKRYDTKMEKFRFGTKWVR